MRFQPDTLGEAVLWPLAMAAPDANVYVELMAPDFRFVFALALLVLLALRSIAARRRRPRTGTGAAAGAGAGVLRAQRRPVLVLAAALAAGFVVWLATSGNGRYFAAGLLVVGPVCVGLAWLLPATRALRLTLVVGMLALQAFAVLQTSPWRGWSLAPWREAPFFDVEVPAQWRAQPATVVTLSAITYSALAPFFHPQSRWMSLHNAPALQAAHPLSRRAEAFLAEAQPNRLLLLVPVVPGTLTAQKLPNAPVLQAMAMQLAPYGLSFAVPQSCSFLHSRSMEAMGLGEKSPQQRAESGFWLCHLARAPAGAPAGPQRERRYDAVFRVLEQQCPRFLPPGGDGPSLVLRDGEVRSYLQAEMKVYVQDNGEVHYKYYRALNPVLVGRVQDVLAGRAKVDCGNIRGRAGLPWEREI